MQVTLGARAAHSDADILEEVIKAFYALLYCIIYHQLYSSRLLFALQHSPRRVELYPS